jgi:hypothetical protein
VRSDAAGEIRAFAVAAAVALSVVLVGGLVMSAAPATPDSSQRPSPGV